MVVIDGVCLMGQPLGSLTYAPGFYAKKINENAAAIIMEEDIWLSTPATSDNRILTLSYPYVATGFLRGIRITE